MIASSSDVDSVVGTSVVVGWKRSGYEAPIWLVLAGTPDREGIRTKLE